MRPWVPPPPPKALRTRKPGPPTERRKRKGRRETEGGETRPRQPRYTLPGTRDSLGMDSHLHHGVIDANGDRDQQATPADPALHRLEEGPAPRRTGDPPGAGTVRLRRLPRGRNARAGRPGLPESADPLLRLERDPRQLPPRGRGGPRRPPRRGRQGPAAHRLPPGGFRDDLLLRPRAVAEEGHEAGRQAAVPLPGGQRLRRGLGRAAVAGRPRHPPRRPDAAGGAPPGPDRGRPRRPGGGAGQPGTPDP